MPSPFPGMDPWLERRGLFPDFHDRFLAEISARLNLLLPAPFYAALATRVWLEESERRVVPDIDVVAGAGPRGSGIALAEPITAQMLELDAERLPHEEIAESVIEVYADSDRLIASIELLSPANKTLGDSGRVSYLAKQRELVDRGVHVIEIDLLRGGTHATLAPRDRLRTAGRFDYHIALSMAGKREVVYAQPFGLRDPLPRLAVPLTLAVPGVRVELQPAFDRTYDAGVYGRRVRYDRPCDPPLTPEQQVWANGILNPGAT